MESVSLSLSTRATDDGHLVVVSGEVDMSCAARLAECLVQFANGNVIVDLSAVDFIDSSGLAALVAAHKRITQRGDQLVVHGMSSMALRVMEITGLDHVLNLNGQSPNGH